jgi:cellulose synthase/poly-beta-1,6-N-acetylglucosamine synthase-like glycosyltransferase/peptidoglycan/xylan/chitin deacetylase (PgdA/CDA1 family)
MTSRRPRRALVATRRLLKALAGCLPVVKGIAHPRAMLALAALLALACAMLLNGYLRAEIGADPPRRGTSDSRGAVPGSTFPVFHRAVPRGAVSVGTPPRSRAFDAARPRAATARKGSYQRTVPEEVLTGGPVLTFAADGKVTSHRIPRKTIALTFDDGPDPEWTPKVLEVLRKHDVSGTFFVVGRMAARHPQLIRRILESGNEIGVHTFSHPDLGSHGTGRIDRELARTQLVLAGAAGVTSSLFRAPYTSYVTVLDDRDWAVTRYLGRKGYISTFIDKDSEDWRRLAASKMVRNAMPKAGAGASVLFHDAGGDRAQTVRALGMYIKEMKRRGYVFTTVTGALSAPSAVHKAGTVRLWEGRAMVAAVSLTGAVMPALNVLLLAVGAAVIARFITMPVLAAWHHRSRNRRSWTWGPPVTEPVSVIVPAYNEKECIAHTITSLAASRHPIEIIVVDDGSTDGTADIAEAMKLPSVRVIRQRNAGKPAALNRGVANARHDLIVMMDGDTVFEPGTVGELVRPFADTRVGAVAGNAKVGNRNSVIGAWQHIEYVMGFNLDRRMYDLLRCMPTIPGAIGAFRRTALVDAGGMSEDTLAEDTDITIALHRAGWRIVYAEHARAWTEVPNGVGQLWRQRYRWSYGTMQALWKHRRSVVDRGSSGRFGRVGMPLVVLFQILTPLFAPLIDLFTLYGIFFFDPVRSLAAWASVLLVQLLCALYAFKLDGERYRCLFLLPLQQIVYRQLMYLVLLHSCATAVTGARLPWQKLRRTGEVDAPPRPRVATGQVPGNG